MSLSAVEMRAMLRKEDKVRAPRAAEKAPRKTRAVAKKAAPPQPEVVSLVEEEEEESERLLAVSIRPARVA